MNRNVKDALISLCLAVLIILGYNIWTHDKTCPANPVNQTSFNNSGKWVFSKTYIPNDEHRKGTKVLVTTSFGSPGSVELYNYKF